MVRGFGLEGMENVITNLNREIKRIEGRTLRGLISAAILIHREAEPMIPVDLNNLRASWFYVTSRGEKQIEGGFQGAEGSKVQSDTQAAVQKATGMALTEGAKGAFVVIGLGASYAIFMHEAIDVNFQRPSAEVKFLEKAIKKKEKEVLQVIANNVAIK